MKILFFLFFAFTLGGCTLQREWPFFVSSKKEPLIPPESLKPPKQKIDESQEQASEPPLEPCQLKLSGDNNQSFSLKVLRIDTSCETITINLSYPGKTPNKTDGHNLVVAKKEDLIYLVKRAASNREFDYSPRSSKALISTELIGGGESLEVSLNLSDFDTDQDYVFFCSFPGHYKSMQGPLEFY